MSELRRRATGGAALLAARAGLIVFLGVGANIVLARLLTPREFGIVALGTAFLVLGSGLAEGGLGAALIRREEEPTRRELAAVNALQLGATIALALVVTAAAVPFGRDGLVVATMLAGLPIAVLRAPSVIVLERRLNFREIATMDVVEAIAFYAWALTAVALGAGVWGIATAAIVRAIAGTSVIARLGPVGLVRPRWGWSDVRGLIGFGIRLQAVSLAGMVRDQGLNAGIALLAGIATLGVWNLAWRVLQAPYGLFAAVGRVTYPMIARTRETGGDIRPVLDRTLTTLAVANGALLVAIAGLAPALPALVGPGWEEVPGTLLWAAAALVVGAPSWVVTSSYLFAADDPGAVLRAVIIHSVVWFALALPLVGEVGAPIMGVGWIAAALAGNTVLWRRVAASTGGRIGMGAVVVVAAGLAGVAVGWGVASGGDATVVRGALGVAAGELLFIACLGLLRRSVLRDTWALVGEAVRGATGLGATPRPRGA